MVKRYKEIAWLLLCIALGSCHTSPIQTELSKEIAAEYQHRSSRWPFTLSDAQTDGAPGPTVEEDVLFAGLNLRKYPIWHIHKYRGIDLRPVEIQASSDRTLSTWNEERAQDGSPESEKISPAHVGHATRDASEIIHVDRVRNYVRVAQGEISRTAERDSTQPDLSFLDDLGGLAPFLPDFEDDGARATGEGKAPNAVGSNGLLGSLLSKLLGQTDQVTSTTVRPAIEDEESEDASFPKPGFFGPLLDSISSLKIEKPIEAELAEPEAYYSPGIRGSYVAIKLPADFDFRSKSQLMARLDPRIATLVSNEPFDNSRMLSIAALSTLTIPTNHHGETIENSRLQTVRKITDNSLPIREAIDFRGNGELIKNKETKNNKRIYSGYSNVRRSNGDSTETPIAYSSTLPSNQECRIMRY